VSNEPEAYVFAPPPVISVPVVGSTQRFPVHRIYCVGRNYAEHTREMGFDPDKEPPFFFQKNPDCLVFDGRFPYPIASQEVHFEIEMVTALKSGGLHIEHDDALDHVYGYATALDMTRRDLQGVAKKMGRPWEVGKAFEKSAPCTALTRVDDVGHPDRGEIWLDVNGERRQSGDLSQMIWSVPEQISFLSGLFELRAGDLIMTGTPAGVGPVSRGDTMVGQVCGLETLKVEVV